MSVNLITGNLFSPIQASQDSDYQAGTFGEKTQILNVGSKMALSIVDNSTIRCEDGVLVTREGRRIQIDNGDVVEWTIPTGTQGTTSYYIVGFRLYTDDESAQLCDTFVQSVSGPGATITEDTFRDGAVEIFVSVARVVQNGITLDSIQPLIPTAMTTDDAKSAISQINSNKQNKTDNTLTTTDKTIVGAINEINSDLIETNSTLTHNICANLLNPTAQTQTINGVTFTNNGDGTYTVNGTASADTPFHFAKLNDTSILKNAKLVGCPVGGSGMKFLMLATTFNGSTFVKDHIDDGSGVILSNIPSEATNIRFSFVISHGYTANNLLFKPMFTTDLNATYDDYVPYTGGGGRLNEDVARLNSNLSSQVHDIEPRSYWSRKYSFYQQVGNITVVNFDITWGAAIALGGELLSGLPTPPIDTQLNFPMILCDEDGSNQRISSCAITADGKIITGAPIAFKERTFGSIVY